MNHYINQDRGNTEEYKQYLDAMDAVVIEKIASSSVFFEPKKGNTIVDIGMASGMSSAILAQIFPQTQVIGVDINQKMIDFAKSNYQSSNLSFILDDGEKLLNFEKNSVDGFFNCSAIHHITSYNGYDNNRAYNTLKRQTELLKEHGVIVVRDFVKPEEKEVILELSTKEKDLSPTDCELLILFSKTARSLAPENERGFPLKEVSSFKESTRCFRLFYSDAVEFIRRKDYYQNWDIELNEEYGYFTQREFEECFQKLGLRVIISSPIYNPWIIENRYKGQFRIFDISGKEIGFPPTNYLIAGEKVSKGTKIKAVRHLSPSEDPYLKHSSYKNLENNKIYDVVERPNEVIDIIPFYRGEQDQIIILAKYDYPRPLSVIEKTSAIDGKRFGGYISEGITLEKICPLEKQIYQRFKLSEEAYCKTDISLQYYPSAGGIKEKVVSSFYELREKPMEVVSMNSGYSGFKESGVIRFFDAFQLLNIAQTGVLAEARLELNIYHLFHELQIPLPKWMGKKVGLKKENNIVVSSLSDLLRRKENVFIESDSSSKFLRTERVLFAEENLTKSEAVFEYVYPEKFSCNTLLTLPVCMVNGIVYVGVELRSLPVPQIYTQNSNLITAPAFRLSEEIKNIHELENYLMSLQIGDTKVINHFKLGEKYFPSIGITPEQVYPYIVWLEKPTSKLYWIPFTELRNKFPDLQDAHLLICLARLYHALNN